jgi:hypothetical protein
MTKSIEIIIEEKILSDYKNLRNYINSLAKCNSMHYLILTALATGDRRFNSAFKKANISFNEGLKIIDDLCNYKILKIEKSLDALSKLDKDYIISNKLIFVSPFVKFWFACISPIFRGIRDGDYIEFFDNFNNRKADLISFVFEQLSMDIFKTKIKDKTFVKIGRYWDNSSSIDLLAKTKDGKIFAGLCKYTNNKIRKNTLNNLKNICLESKIDVDTFVIFSKKGYSAELKKLKSDNIMLFTIKNFSCKA